MKITKSYSLDSDLIEYIEDYRKQYNLNSSSTALGRILLLSKMGMLAQPTPSIQPMQPVQHQVQIVEEEEKEEEPRSSVSASLFGEVRDE